MKIRKKEITSCDHSDGRKIKVMKISYTHKGMSGEVFIRDFKPALEKETMKKLHGEVKKAYNKYQLTKK